MLSKDYHIFFFILQILRPFLIREEEYLAESILIYRILQCNTFNKKENWNPVLEGFQIIITRHQNYQFCDASTDPSMFNITFRKPASNLITYKSDKYKRQILSG